MVIYNGFFRKKNVKIYIALFTLLFCLILILIKGREYYIELNNKTYGNSIVSITSDKDISKKLKYYSNVKETEIGILFKTNGEELFFIVDESLEDDEIIVANSTEAKGQISISINDIIENFTIKDYHQKSSNEFYISRKKYQDLEKENHLLIYRLNLKNWSNYSKTVDKLLEDNFDVSYQINKTSNVDFDNQIRYFSIITIVLIVILIITLIISIFNLIEDEQKTNTLYRYLGYKKSKVKMILIQKLILIIAVSIVVGFILSNIILIKI